MAPRATLTTQAIFAFVRRLAVDMTDEQLTAVWNDVNDARAPLTTKAIFAFARRLLALARESSEGRPEVAEVISPQSVGAKTA